MKQEVNLVIQTAFLGDLILSIPVLKRIKKIFPEQELMILCKKGLGDFLIQEKIVDRAIEIEKSNTDSYREAQNTLRSYDVHHLFCLHRSTRSVLFARQVRAKKKIGFTSFLGIWVFDDVIEYVEEYPEVIRQFKILESIDSVSFEKLRSKDYSYLNKEDLPDVPEFFSFASSEKRNTDSRKVAIFPGSVWATKKWTKEGFTQLISLMLKNKFEIELHGGPDEKDLCTEIAQNFTDKKVSVWAGKLSILETIRSLKSCSFVVCNDSAPTHMAAYINIPAVTIFGPTVLNLGFRPWSKGSQVVQNNDLKCRPCGKHGHHQCPLGHHHCMVLIEASQVFEKIKQISKN